MNRKAFASVLVLLATGCTPTKTDHADNDGGADVQPRADDSGRRTVSEKDSVGAVAIDKDSVWFTTDWTTSAIRRAARTAGATPSTVCTLPKRITGTEQIFVDETNVWVAGTHGLFRSAKGAGSDAPCPKISESGMYGIVKLGKTVFVAAQNDKSGTNILAFDDVGRMTTASVLPEAPAGLTTDGKSLFVATGGPFTTNVHKLDANGKNAVPSGTAGDKIQAAPDGKIYSIKTFAVVEGAGRHVGGGNTRHFLVVGKKLYSDANVSAKAPTSVRIETLGTKESVDRGSLPGAVYGLAADERDLYVATGGMLLRVDP